MRVLFFAGAALVGGAAVFGAVRAGQEATPVVAAEAKRVIRQVTQTELVEQLKAELAATQKHLAECQTLKHGLLSSSQKLADELEATKAKLASRNAEVDILHRKLSDVEKALASMVAEAADLRSALANK
jgi:septal ring factor EnvC (AmiA/AmiB activator)